MNSRNAKPQSGTVLLIDQPSELQGYIYSCLRDDGYDVHCECSLQLALDYWRNATPEVVICGLCSDSLDGLAILREIATENPDTQVIVVAEATAMKQVAEALRIGASDFLICPISDVEVLLHAVKRAFEEHQLNVDNRRYREALEAKNKELKESLRLLKEDQEAGRAVQLKMLPEPHQKFGDVDIEYKIIPSLYLSGDCVDYFSLGENRIGFYLADVSGHGASSAFVTVLLKTTANRVKQRLQGALAEQFPLEILHRANEELLPLGLGKHLAIFCGYIDLAARRLTYACAAHFPPPILINDGKVSTLEGKGLPVGLFEEVSYEKHEVTLGKAFRLVMFSDGILELIPSKTVAEKVSQLLEIVANGRHNVSQLMDHLGLHDLAAVPDDIALMTIAYSE